MPRPIFTERLKLRPFRKADAAKVAVCVNDMDVARWLTHVPHPYGVADGESFIARHADKPMVFAVTENDRLIGCMSIVEELGYWFGKAWWGHGFATEAARAVVARHFDNGGVELRSGYVLGNAASRNVLKKLGFEETAVEGAILKSTGEPVHVQKMHLTQARWRNAA